ncbi:hypothetical protein PENANT_c006G01104 [Penicillium antarcticum]|uniref:Uncharacterized protein n=1 Tax=Penicillium antarcticum TaxID=416450 RepID=A0A1V6QDP5_9EURO|nr:hypothetical protein PENANT_c006G01104 [Penicillium antarcticum]
MAFQLGLAKDAGTVPDFTTYFYVS